MEEEDRERERQVQTERGGGSVSVTQPLSLCLSGSELFVGERQCGRALFTGIRFSFLCTDVAGSREHLSVLLQGVLK